MRRSLHSATQLSSGLVLIAGGSSPAGTLGTAELYDPVTGRSRAVAPMHVPRSSHTATRLPDGRVLIVGGYGSLGRAANSAEIFDPATETFSLAPTPLAPHGEGHAALLLPGGQVLIVGGDTSGVGATPTAEAERFDPARNLFERTGPLRVPRRIFGAVGLPDGRILIAGGTTTGKRAVSSAEIYDPSSGTFALTGSLHAPRHKHAGLLLADGRVMVLGGTEGGDDSRQLATSEVYDPATGQFSLTRAMLQARYKFSVARLLDGTVFVAGGAPWLAEIVSPASGAVRPVAGETTSLRFYSALTPLSDGSLLVSGGYSDDGPRATVWRFHPSN